MHSLREKLSKGNPTEESLSEIPTQFLGSRRNYRSGVKAVRWAILIACLAHVGRSTGKTGVAPKPTCSNTKPKKDYYKVKLEIKSKVESCRFGYFVPKSKGERTGTLWFASSLKDEKEYTRTHATKKGLGRTYYKYTDYTLPAKTKLPSKPTAQENLPWNKAASPRPSKTASTSGKKICKDTHGSAKACQSI